MASQRRYYAKLAIVSVATLIALYLIGTKPFILPSSLPPDMNVHAPQRCVAVFIVCMSLWFTNLIPLAATGLLAIGLMPTLGILPADRAFELFGNGAVFFMLGVFLLAAATITTGLSKRITLIALQRFDRSPGTLVVGVTVSASFLALWMPEHAVAAMIYPIVVEIVDSLKLAKGSPFAKKLFLGLAWGSAIGGVGTFLGGARAPLALGLLRKRYPELSISFVDWMIAALPIVIIMTVVALLTLRFTIKSDVTEIKNATRFLDERVRRLGPMSKAEMRLTVLGLATIASWVLLGERFNIEVIAILSAVMLFVLRIVDWRDAQSYVNWGVLIMYGGAVALGMALNITQAMQWVVEHLVPPGVPTLVLLAGMVLVAILLTELISNSAAVAVLLPIGFSLCAVAEISPILMTFAVTIPAGLAFLLPISSPPNAISFSAGHYSVREVIQFGWPLSVAALITTLLVMVVWWGWILGIGDMFDASTVSVP